MKTPSASLSDILLWSCVILALAALLLLAIFWDVPQPILPLMIMLLASRSLYRYHHMTDQEKLRMTINLPYVLFFSLLAFVILGWLGHYYLLPKVLSPLKSATYGKWW